MKCPACDLFGESIDVLCMTAAPFAALVLNLKALAHEPVCKQAPRWPSPLAAVVTVHEEVDSMFARDPGEHNQVAASWESEGLIM